MSVKIHSPPHLPERTPESSVLASEHNTPVKYEWSKPQSHNESEQKNLKA